jgi:hypothetical protein
MTRLQAVGVVLIALGLIYALLYAAWLRKRRRHGSAAVAVAEPGREPGKEPAADEASAVRAEGTYVSTTTAASRHERVAVQGLGNRARATVTVRRGHPEELVRFERQGESDVVIPRSRLLDVRRDRGMAGKFVGANRLLVLRWRADDEAIYETGFLPRYRADLDRLEMALWWHQGGSSVTPEPADQPSAQQETTTVEPHTQEGNPT